MSLFNEKVELVTGAALPVMDFFAMKYDCRHTIKIESNGDASARVASALTGKTIDRSKNVSAHFGCSKLSFLAKNSWRIANGWTRALALLAFAVSASAEELKVPGGLIDIEFVRSSSSAWEGVARKWVETSAHAVSALREVPGPAVEASYHFFRGHSG
jgi:hypothetical protein